MEQIIAKLLTDFENGKMSRRQLISSLAVTAVAAGSSAPALGADAAKKSFKATTVNHISYQVADYARTRDFYSELLGMKVSQDDGKQAFLSFGNTFLLPRKSRQPDNKPLVDHICYTLANYNDKEVEEELKRRGLNPRLDTGGGTRSFHIKDPDGFDVQLAGPEMKA